MDKKREKLRENPNPSIINPLVLGGGANEKCEKFEYYPLGVAWASVQKVGLIN